MADRAVVIADADRPLSELDWFEPERRMSRITLPDQIIFVSDLLNLDRQIVK
jgi:hypothetical protein